MKKAFFHKDYGLFMHLASKKKSAEKSTYLFYLPRTSLFTGKDEKQLNFKFADFHSQANPWLQKEPAFFSFFEQQYHLFLVKDLVKEGSP